MLAFAVILLVALQLEVEAQLKLPDEPNVLTPPYFNIATGKKTEATATCGAEEEQVYCKLTGGPNEYGYGENLYQGQFCDVCDSLDPTKSHPVKYAIDGTEKWWQSPPLSQGTEYNKINITIKLGQVFHVAYTIIKFANSPRAGTWVLERSSDHGKTFQPWQYFADSNSDCHNLFGIDAFQDITRDDSVICTSEYSAVVPLERGEVIVSMINGRPGAYNFSHSPTLQEWTKATDVRLRLLRTKTLLGHLMAVQRQDPTVTRRYYYSIKDISIGGRCVCNGHADTCSPDLEDKYKSKCECRHHTCGDSCEYCCPGFVQKAWRAAVPASANECEECNCYGHSTECLYDEGVAIRRLSIDLRGNYDGGGVCQNCSHYTAGINCENCVDGYYRPANVDVRDPNGCKPCDCDSNFTVGTCEPVTGRCYCKPEYAGDRCDRCAPGYHEYPECEPCPCYYNGTRDGVCIPTDDGCPCKYNYAGMYCAECEAGFYHFPDCIPCTCIGRGVVNQYCDQHTGQCECDRGFGGLNCDQCSPGFYSYPTCQSCACLTAFTTAEVCDANTGKCLCTEFITGESCNQCIAGYFDFPNCRECECSPEGSASELCDAETGKCECKLNYRGPNCDECAPEFYGYPNCLSCDCDLRGSVRTTCDRETGQCSCSRFIAGRRCEQCAPEYFNFPRCENCKCDPRGIKAVITEECLAFTTGQCDCKENVVGTYCNMCDSLHYNMTLGCVDCSCFIQGTLDGVASCDMENGDCTCKIYAHTQRCTQCPGGFYGLTEANYFGCSGCQCNAGGAYSTDCDTVNGQCSCKDGVAGRRCDSVEEGRYFPTLLQHQFEVEDGHTASSDVLRFGFDETAFPGFSNKGYGEFSNVQRQIIIPVTIEKYGLYRIHFYYVQPYASSVANITFSPVSAEGSMQSFEATFEVAVEPKLMAVSEVLVLNQGQWNVIITGEPGLLIDYFILLPSEYYEPSILQAKVIEPCKGSPTAKGKECIMYTHPAINYGSSFSLTETVNEDRRVSPSSSHPTMTSLDGNSIVGYDVLEVSLIPETIGEYVLVLEYASNSDRMQTIEATVSNGTFPTAKFNIYSCNYAFLCRQVALTSANEVMVFHFTEPNIHVEMRVDPGEVAYVSRVYAIPRSNWTIEYVEPKRRCIIKEGTSFDDCVAWTYPVPETGRKFEAGGGGDTTGASIPTATDATVEAEFVDDNTTIQIHMDLPPGKYVFLLHYYNPDHLSFSPVIVLAAGVNYEGGANVTHCPDGDGCRAVVISETGATVLDVTATTQTMTITVPQGKSFWLDYVLAIPEDSYKASFLDLMRYDNSRRFFEECYGVGSEGLLDLAEDPSEFCRAAVFTLTMDFNDGALTCQCNDKGTAGGANADCEAYGGKCPCKPSVIGPRCEHCATGFHGFPNCQQCDCNGLLCDEINGNCICPPNTVEPDCKGCVPFTHSYHPLAGCLECDCNTEGVEDAADLGCSKDNGQCRCKDNVEGPKCDKCAPGFFSFPKCRPCVCNEHGRMTEGCDPVNGQCLCKENVEGQQCDRCKTGSFYLDGNNPLGCTACFCFGVSSDCSGTLFPITEIVEMNGWRLLNLKTPTPEVRYEGQVASVDIIENGGVADPTRANLYWAAPEEYLGDKLGSYGGQLQYMVESRSAETGGRGDDSGESIRPAPLSATSPNVIMKGNGMIIGWAGRDLSSKVMVTLTETNFVHQTTRNPVRREDMMTVLSGLSSLHIKASDDPQAAFVSLSEVSLSTTDYYGSLGSGLTIRTVEECICPKGYTGDSCQICSRGHYRENQGPYLGYCAECDCYGHCDRCTQIGSLIDQDDCLHNTAGDRCDRCKDGYIGDPISRDPETCQHCPCPYQTAEGNFASTCQYDEGGLVCNCKPGYTGSRCEQCDLGYFGNPGVIGGKCQMCNCHGNLDVSTDLEPCDSLTGACSDCKFHTGGKYCEQCDDGYFGDATIARNCAECSCYQCGALQCDHLSGACACKAHVIGQNCNQCEPGYYDLNSCTGCHQCKCDVGAKTNECDEVTGQCTCAPNVVGLKCDKCAQGHWDYSSMGCKPCNCHNDGDCNPLNGECKCPPGITGRQCDKCEMDRYILPRGGNYCEPCDDCTHVLLDDIEASTKNIQDASKDATKISVGVFVADRFIRLETKTKNAQMTIKQIDEKMDDVDYDGEKLLKSAKALKLEKYGSGSGFSLESSGDLLFATEEKVDSYDVLLADLGKVEDAVSVMCSHTDALLETVEKTNSKAIMLDAKYSPASDEIKQFETDSRQFIDELNTESSGDDHDHEYLQKKTDINMMLEKMKQRDLDPMLNSSNFELLQAQSLYSSVLDKFILPSQKLEEDVGNMKQNFSTKTTKLNELRHRLNSVTGTATETGALNTMNRIELESLRTTLMRIREIRIDINATIVDSYILLGSNSTTSFRTLLSSEDLVNVDEQLENIIKSNSISLEGMEELVNKSTEKANMLKTDAETLIKLVDETRNDSRTISAVDASNRYARIFNAMEKAKEYANKAELDATDILDETEKRNLSALANDKSDAGSNLLSEIQKMNNVVLTRHAMLETGRMNSTHLGQLTDDLSHRLSMLSDGISNLDDDSDEKVGEVRNVAYDAGLIADEVMRRSEELQQKINEAPDTNISINAELTAIEDSLGSTPDILQDVTLSVTELKGRVAQFDRLTKEAALDEKMDKIRKLIELSRSTADNVKVTMKFAGSDDIDSVADMPSYVQPRLPIQVAKSQDYLKIELYVNTNVAADSSILYMGDVSSDTGDYMSLETRDGRAHFNYKVGDGLDELVSTVPINDNNWHRIIIQRIGNKGRLEVQLPDPGGDEIFDEGAYRYDVKEGQTRSENVKAIMPAESMALVIGGMPFTTMPSAIQNREMTGCVRGVTVNGENVGLWNFVSYNGPQPGQNCPKGLDTSEGYKLMWRFRGHDSYLRASQQQLRQQGFIIGPRARSTIVQFKILTVQTDALLFLVGQNEKQFFAVEIKNGKFVVTCNFGWEAPRQKIVKDFPDVNTYTQPLAIKAGVANIGRNRKMVVLAINSALKLNITFSDWAPNVQGDGWVGGLHRSEIPEGLRKHVTTIDNHFRGCLGSLAFHFRTSFNVYSAYERIGVTPGCRAETISTIEVDGDDFVTVPTALPDADQVSGLVTIRTEAPGGGTIILAKEINGNHVSLSMVDGYIVLSDGLSALRSNDTYNDGLPHTIEFDRYFDGSLRLNIDDKFVKELDVPEITDEGQRRRKRRARGRMQETSSKTALFAESSVHVFVGGSPDDPKFSGCIGNIQIDEDSKHPGLLTEGAKCGSSGNAKCFGKPKFNRCNMGPTDEIISAKFDSEIVTVISRSSNGMVSAMDFTNSETLNGDEIDGHNVTTADGGQRKRKGKRKGNRKKPGNRNRDTVLGIDASQPYNTGYDKNCHLPLEPDTSGMFYPGVGYSKYSVDNFDSLNWRFSLKMRTLSREGILFFMNPSGYLEYQEHVAVYLVRGKITLSVRFGNNRIRIKSYRKYNDGRWHDITFQLKAERLQMIIDDTIRNEMFNETSETFSSLMLFYVGGLQEMEKQLASSFISRTNISDFIGCIQKLAVNDQPIEISTSTRLLVKIKLRPCFEGKTEEGIFFSNSDQNEDGSFMMVYNTFNVKTYLNVSMEIRPRAQSGVLLAVGGQTGNFFQLSLIKGKVVARVQQETDMLMSIYDPSDYDDAICDGNWHKIHVIKAKNILTLSVDGNMVVPIEQGNIEIRSCYTDGPLFIGGVPADASVGNLLTDRRQYTGCMQEINIDHYPITIDKAIEVTEGVSGNACPLY